MIVRAALAGSVGLLAGVALASCGWSDPTGADDAGGFDVGAPSRDAKAHDAGTSDGHRTTRDASVHDGGARDTGAHEDAPPEDAPSEADGLSAAIVAACIAKDMASCGLGLECNTPTAIVAWSDASPCVARSLLSCEGNLVLPGSTFTPAEQLACAAATARESCTTFLDQDTPDACVTQPGSRAIGDPCQVPRQCSSAFCAISPANACGTCQVLPVVGDSCGALTTCGQSLVCTLGKCVRNVTAPGQPCGATQPCAGWMTCVIPAGSPSGTCVLASTHVGAACDPTGQISAGCDVYSNLYCVADPMSPDYETCQPIAVAAAGEPCGPVGYVETICRGAACLARGAAYQCIPYAADDAACNTAVGPLCQQPARCIGTAIDGGVSGTCTIIGTGSCP